MWWLCLRADGLEQIESLLLLGVGHGGFGEHWRLSPGARTATSIANDACEIVEKGPEGMDDGIVIELFGMHLP